MYSSPSILAGLDSYWSPIRATSTASSGTSPAATMINPAYAAGSAARGVGVMVGVTVGVGSGRLGKVRVKLDKILNCADRISVSCAWTEPR